MGTASVKYLWVRRSPARLLVAAVHSASLSDELDGLVGGRLDAPLGDQLAFLARIELHGPVEDVVSAEARSDSGRLERVGVLGSEQLVLRRREQFDLKSFPW